MVWDIHIQSPEGQTSSQGPSGPRQKGGYNFEFYILLIYEKYSSSKTLGWFGTYFHSKLVKNAKMCEKLVKIWR